MSNVVMSDGSEILDESKPFSALAAIAFVFSLIGALAVMFVPFVPVALAAIGLGVLAKFLGRKDDYSGFSMFLALLAVAIGCLSVSTGTLARTFAMRSELARSQELAEMYLDLVYKRDFDRLALINNAEAPPEEFGRRKPTDQEIFEFRKKSMKNHPTYQEIGALPEAPQWQFVSLKSEEDTPYFCSYRLLYRDSNRSKSPLYVIGVRRDQPKGGPAVNPENRGRELTEEDLMVHWTVEFMEKSK